MSQSVSKDPGDITLLIVDDNDEFREAMAFGFRRKGFNTLEATCGDEALRVFKTWKVNVILSDMRMPGGTGATLLNKVMEVDPNAKVILFITADEDMSVEEAYEGGRRGCLLKAI